MGFFHACSVLYVYLRWLLLCKFSFAKPYQLQESIHTYVWIMHIYILMHAYIHIYVCVYVYV